MAHTTDFVGHLDIDPPLNDAEAAHLTTLTHARAAGVAVPGAPIDACPWVPCSEGCCLSHDGIDRGAHPVGWLRYLIDHLLKPDAAEARAAEPLLDGFTFDHRLDGVVVGCRRDTRELFSIVVEHNAVDRRIMVPGDPAFRGQAPLAYQKELDRALAARRQRRGDTLGRRQPVQGAVVLDLQSRRR